MHPHELPQGEYNNTIKIRIAPRVLDLLQRHFQIKHAMMTDTYKKELSTELGIEVLPYDEDTAPLFPETAAKEIIDQRDV